MLIYPPQNLELVMDTKSGLLKAIRVVRSSGIEMIKVILTLYKLKINIVFGYVHIVSYYSIGFMF